MLSFPRTPFAILALVLALACPVVAQLEPVEPAPEPAARELPDHELRVRVA